MHRFQLEPELMPAMDRLLRYLAGWRRVDPERLSVSGELRRTNNDAESFMAIFGGQFPTAHPTWWAFVDKANMVSSMLRRAVFWNIFLKLDRPVNFYS